MNPVRHLQHKRWLIAITNRCDKSCGGCAQLCGHFTPEQVWETPVGEIDRIIKILKPFTRADKNNWNELTMFGGEPTLHSEWDKIPEMLYEHAPTKFRVNTNGRLGHDRYHRYRNVTYYVDPHPDGQEFYPTMIAAQDVLHLEADSDYWDLAVKQCPIWDTEGAMIYNGRAYYCEHAAAMDWMFYGGIHGWPVVDGVNPFDRTEVEIAEQASRFCKHCAWCVPGLKRQVVNEPTKISPSNYSLFPKRNLLKLVQLNEIEKEHG